jgi:hypothetical protein
MDSTGKQRCEISHTRLFASLQFIPFSPTAASSPRGIRSFGLHDLTIKYILSHFHLTPSMIISCHLSFLPCMHPNRPIPYPNPCITPDFPQTITPPPSLSAQSSLHLKFQVFLNIHSPTSTSASSQRRTSVPNPLQNPEAICLVPLLSTKMNHTSKNPIYLNLPVLRPLPSVQTSRIPRGGESSTSAKFPRKVRYRKQSSSSGVEFEFEDSFTSRLQTWVTRGIQAVLLST